tara:strand:+ start:467 stop:958 length:492 start_codon:yes stop_codon:yes gene_type:complete
VSNDLVERLRFLADVIEKERDHLDFTSTRLFPKDGPLTAESVKGWVADPEVAERMDAFVARFSRLQDTLGDKLIPALLRFTGEHVGPAVDNLNRVEKFGWIDSAEDWMLYCQLRNQMVHEYIEDYVVLADSLEAGRLYVPKLLTMADRLVAEARQRIAASFFQ